MCVRRTNSRKIWGEEGGRVEKREGVKEELGGTSEIGDILSGALEQNRHLPSLETLNRPTPKHSSL